MAKADLTGTVICQEESTVYVVLDRQMSDSQDVMGAFARLAPALPRPAPAAGE